eukprot:1157891-Pelagomonas_calceolata.AAC.4
MPSCTIHKGTDQQQAKPVCVWPRRPTGLAQLAGVLSIALGTCLRHAAFRPQHNRLPLVKIEPKCRSLFLRNFLKGQAGCKHIMAQLHRNDMSWVSLGRLLGAQGLRTTGIPWPC